MNKLAIIFYKLLLSAAIGFSQNPNVTIVGKILGYNGSKKIEYSISPYPNSFDRESISPDSTGQFIIIKTINRTHFFYMYYEQDSIEHYCKLILRPNNYYKIISVGYKPDGIHWNVYYSPEIYKLEYRVEGSPYLKTHAGQMYWNLIDNGTMGSIYHNEWDLHHPELLIDTLQARIKKQESVFSGLLERGEIDKEFYDLAKLNIEYFQAYKLAATISDTWQMHKYEIKDSSLRNRLYEVYPRIFEQYPVKDVNMEWIFLFDRYVSLYLCFREDYKDGVFKPKIRKGPVYNKTMRTSDNVLTDEANKYFKFSSGMNYVASLDLNASQHGKELLEKYPEYKDTPAGKLLEDYLIPKAEEFEKLSEIELPSSVKILDKDNQINTIQQLLDSIKGQPALIDCWATWCAPCIGQFKYNKELKPFLKKHSIQMVYIAFELDSNLRKWENLLKAYDLSGYHIIANALLKVQLKNLYEGTIALPTFIIVDSDGRILIKNAAYPSDEQKLYEQLKKELKL